MRCQSYPLSQRIRLLIDTYKQPYTNSGRSLTVPTTLLLRRMTPRHRSAGATRSSTACTPLAPSARGILPPWPLRKFFVTPNKDDQLTVDGVPEIAGSFGHSSVKMASTLISQFMNQFSLPSLAAYRDVQIPLRHSLQFLSAALGVRELHRKPNRRPIFLYA